MSKILSKGLTFDDVLLVPAYSEVTPDVVDVTAWLTPSISLNIPLVSAAMDTVTESAMAISMARAGGIGIVHKNMSIERQKLEIEKVKKSESGMIIDPITVEPDDTVEHALDLMHAYRVSGLPVVREKKLVGILTNRDVRFVEDLAGTKVRDVMTSENLITVPTGTTLEEAKHHLHTHRIEKLLVVDEKGELAGLLTMKDIDKEVAYSTRASYQNYVQNGRAATQMLEEKDDGFYRAEKTFFRCVNDNAAFGLKGISHSSSVMNTRAINFIETLGYCMHSYYTRYDGNTEIADSLLGIKYVLDRGESGDQNRRLNPAYEARWAYDYTNENGTAKTITAYENTNALSIGYMVDEDVQKIDHLGNDNPFNSQNIFMSTMSGQTTFDENGQFQSWHEYYTPLNLAENPIVSDAITTSPYGEQTKYDVTGDGDPTVDFHLVAESNEPIYIYFKTEFQKKVNLWMSTWNDSEWSEAENGWKESNSGDFTWKDADEYAKNNGGFQSMGEYFEGDNYMALRLGTFEPGTKITLRMTIANEEKFTIVKNFLFYTYHPDVFQEDIDILKQNQWQIDTKKSNDRKLTGTITAEEGQIMMTSIPDQPGWTVKVDGKKVDQVAIVDAMIGVPLSAGEHTVTMTYTPPGWWIGMGTLAGGIILIVLFWFGDRKRYAAMLAEIEAEKEREQQQAKKRVKLKSGTKDKANDDSPEKLLEKLEALHQQGILDDKEFAAKKAEIEKKKKADGKQT